MRLKNSCNILSLLENHDELTVKNVSEQKSEVPFVSADLDFNNSNFYCTLDVQKSFNLWDIERRYILPSKSY